jgi:murein L,D-transpeptidase YcbB/YkuD
MALALLMISVAACDGGPFRSKADTGSLQALVTDPQVRAFYEARQWKAAWDRDSRKALLKVLGGAAANGLRSDLFLKEPLPRDPSARDAALTSAALRYAAALARGYVDPRKISKVYTVPRPKADVAAGLAKALAGRDLEQWFESLPPQTDEYWALSKAHIRYLQLAAKAPPAPVPAGKKIRPGSRDPRVPLIADSLAANGYLDRPASQEGQPTAPPPRTYSSELVAAVRRLQADYGLDADGIIGDDTLEVLNAGPSDRARQLAVAMERRRWLDRSPPETRIDVNTAAAFLDYWRNGRPVDHRRVVVGQPDWATPELQSPIVQLVANPYWRVPDSIYEDELAKKGPGYFASQGMEWRDDRLVQLPGPKNALGQVKLDMRNTQSIYLHDTPAKALFAEAERHRSHGCVRVEKALEFAALLAAQDGLIDKFAEALASRDEKYIKLKTEIPVRLLYHTVYFDRAGKLRFQADAYGRDDDVAGALGLRRHAGRRSSIHVEDVGP